MKRQQQLLGFTSLSEKDLRPPVSLTVNETSFGSD
ncbi:uncharacterized protein METZ01_LOCUS114707 [marine metagenome]|uniref:Uncharacterized protein n=1 Tax=marine metagenome TaxID=408172 RepID=A0A381XC84_9ZZZZ